MNKAVFLDRDGVLNKAIIINGKPYPPKNIDEVEFCQDVQKAVENLIKANFLLIGITNQPDVARGLIEKEKVDEINAYVTKKLNLSSILTCYHDDKDMCNCRKPLPGNILLASKKYNINLSESYMVGDRWRDIEAGFLSGCKTFFIDCNYVEKYPVNFDFKVKSLYEASMIILENVK
jgi:D-glycero-D-manno-heptose 1,7-bisphosphate phosphatase